MAEKSIHVEIATPVHNRREITLQCLRSLSRLDRTGLTAHITVVDDGSTDGTSEAIRKQFPEVSIIEADGSLWYTNGTNAGIRAAMENDPDYVLLINDDSVFDARVLRSLVECAEANAPAVVGPLLLSWDEPHKVFQVAPSWSVSYGGWRHLQRQTVWTMPDKAWEVEAIVGNCVLVPAAAIKSVGLMNAKSFPHYGDTDYMVRMKRAGWRLMIEPRARVFCQPNDPLPTLREESFRNLLNRLVLNERSPHSLKRQFMLNWKTSPSRLQGLMASAVFMTRFGLKALGLSGKWPNDLTEEGILPPRVGKPRDAVGREADEVIARTNRTAHQPSR